MDLKIITVATILLPFLLIAEGIKARNSGGFLEKSVGSVFIGNILGFSLLLIELLDFFSISQGSYIIFSVGILLILFTYFSYLMYKTVTQRTIVTYNIELDPLYECTIKALKENNIKFEHNYTDNNSAEMYFSDSKGRIRLKEHSLSSKVTVSFNRVQDIAHYDNILITLEEYVKTKNEGTGKYRGLVSIILGSLLLFVLLYLMVTNLELFQRFSEYIL